MLFTDIPLEKIPTLVKKWLTLTKMHPTELDDIISLTELCTMNNYFIFNKNNFGKTKGLAMGSPLSPIFAGLYMSYLETHVVNVFLQIDTFWHRYIDFFAIICQKLKEHSLTLLNLQGEHIQFAIEVKENNFLPFIDLKVTRYIKIMWNLEFIGNPYT